jgi:hypothetical protein
VRQSGYDVGADCDGVTARRDACDTDEPTGFLGHLLPLRFLNARREASERKDSKEKAEGPGG